MAHDVAARGMYPDGRLVSPRRVGDKDEIVALVQAAHDLPPVTEDGTVNGGRELLGMRRPKGHGGGAPVRGRDPRAVSLVCDMTPCGPPHSLSRGWSYAVAPKPVTGPRPPFRAADDRLSAGRSAVQG